MTKAYYKPTKPIVQPHIDDDFDFEDGFCRRLNKIKGIAELFFCAGSGEASIITPEGYFGIHNILEETTEELRTICYKMLERG